MYQDVARGVFDRTGPFFAVLVVFTFVWVCVRGFARSCMPPQFLDAAKTDYVPSPAIKRISSGTDVAYSLIMLMLIIQLVFANNGAARVEQFLTIVAPYVDEAQMREWRSRLAQVTTRDQFMVILVELEQAGRSKGAIFPEQKWF
jgi:hypothetical protein